jgi:hypothetical protein
MRGSSEFNLSKCSQKIARVGEVVYDGKDVILLRKDLLERTGPVGILL